MKHLKTIFLVCTLVFCFGNIQTTQAQFGKKLLKKVKKNKSNSSTKNSNTNNSKEKSENYNATAYLSNSSGNKSSSVDWGKNVFLNLQFEKPLKDILESKEEKGKFRIGFSLNDGNGRYSPLRFFVPKNALDKKILVVDVVTDTKSATTEYEYPAMNFMDYLNGMKEEKTTVEIIFNKNHKETAKGKFPVDLAGANKKALFQKAKAASEAAASNWALTELPKPFSSPNVTIPKLSVAKIKQMVKTAYGSKISSVLKVVTVGSPEWKVNKNSVGIPKNRYVAGTRTMIAYKGKDGNCYFLDGVYLEQEYSGGGSYGAYRIPKSYTGNMPGDKIKSCSLVK